MVALHRAYSMSTTSKLRAFPCKTVTNVGGGAAPSIEIKVGPERKKTVHL